MKPTLIFLTILFVLNSDFAEAKKVKSPSTFTAPRGGDVQSQLSYALNLAQSGSYEPAAAALFSLSHRPELINERPQIKYILGQMLMELKMNQTAAFQFVDVIRSKHPKYAKMAIEKLSIVADALGDDTILNYAISRVDIQDFPKNLHEMIYFRMGEIKMRSGDYAGAVSSFSKVSARSGFYYQALHSKGLCYLEQNQVDSAIATFRSMIETRQNAPVTDTNKVAAQMGLARALYQKQDWERAIEAYSQIPRDTTMWHDAIFEQSWAMLRSARFRSVLSNFQTIHSAYYEDYYIPESLLLRAIVYLYICKYDEMEKVLSLFENSYGPVRSKIGDFLKNNTEALAYYSEIEKAHQLKSSEKKVELKIPYVGLRSVLNQGDVKRSLHYIEKLQKEKNRIESNGAFKMTPLGIYALKILGTRSKNAKLAVGEMTKAHLMNIRIELRDLYEQAGFIRYEMLSGQKEVLKKKVAGKNIEENQIDEKVDREFYIQNGYEYYPFRGEYWLDEIGNYHFLGKQSCE